MRNYSIQILLVLITSLFITVAGLAQDHTVIIEADTYISGKNEGNYVHGHPDSTGDNYVMLVVKNEGEPEAGNSYYREAYVLFDLSSVDEEIEKVQVKLWGLYKTQEGYEAYEDTLDFGSYLIEEDDWDEATLTWNTAPLPNFDKQLDTGPFFWHQDMTGTNEDGETVYYYGWNEFGDLDPELVEAERTGDGKISFNIWGRDKKIWGETEKTWYGFVSKDSAAMVDADIAPRLLIWVKGDDGNAVEADQSMPFAFNLKANYPNPFNPSTTIGYSLSKNAETTLTIYNVLGQPIRVFSDAPGTVGHHEIEWNGISDQGQKAPSGLYFYELKSGDHVLTRKMVLTE